LVEGLTSDVVRLTVQLEEAKEEITTYERIVERKNDLIASLAADRVAAESALLDERARFAELAQEHGDLREAFKALSADFVSLAASRPSAESGTSPSTASTAAADGTRCRHGSSGAGSRCVCRLTPYFKQTRKAGSLLHVTLRLPSTWTDD
jgi:G3E family GTPase